MNKETKLLFKICEDDGYCSIMKFLTENEESENELEDDTREKPFIKSKQSFMQWSVLRAEEFVEQIKELEKKVNSHESEKGQLFKQCLINKAYSFVYKMIVSELNRKIKE